MKYLPNGAYHFDWRGVSKEEGCFYIGLTTPFSGYQIQVYFDRNFYVVPECPAPLMEELKHRIGILLMMMKNNQFNGDFSNVDFMVFRTDYDEDSW